MRSFNSHLSYDCLADIYSANYHWFFPIQPFPYILYLAINTTFSFMIIGITRIVLLVERHILVLIFTPASISS